MASFGLAPTVPCPSCVVAPELDQDCRGGLPRAQQRGRIPSFDLLLTLWGCSLAQGGSGLKCTLKPGHGEFLTNQHPQVLLLRATFNPFSPHLCLCLELPQPTCRTLPLGLLNFIRLPQNAEVLACVCALCQISSALDPSKMGSCFPIRYVLLLPVVLIVWQ